MASERLVPSARRSGAVVLGASMVGHVSNYLFYIVTARTLTVGELAQVTALTSLGTMIFLPYSGVQAAVARAVARDVAQGWPDRAQASVAWALRRTLVVQAGVAVVAVLGAPAAVAALGTSATTWLLGASWLVLGAGLQVMLGPLQGQARFGHVALLLAGPLGALRLLFAVPLVLLAGASGAMGALVLATLVGLVLAAPGVRGFRVPPGDRRPDPEKLDGVGPPTEQGPRIPLAGLTVTVVALLAIASLTNVDVVLAKVNLDPLEAGLYSAAALLGKIAFHGPSALGVVLLPLITRRLARNEDVHRPVLAALGVVGGSGLAFCAVLLVAPPALITGVFGAGYADGFRFVLGVALAMTVAALLYVHLMVALAAHDRTFVVVLAVAALMHVLLLALLARSPGAVVLITASCVVLALLWRESTSRFGTVPLVRDLVRERRRRPRGTSPEPR